jgi:hypothetical protein
METGTTLGAPMLVIMLVLVLALVVVPVSVLPPLALVFVLALAIMLALARMAVLVLVSVPVLVLVLPALPFVWIHVLASMWLCAVGETMRSVVFVPWLETPVPTVPPLLSMSSLLFCLSS